MAAGDVAIWPSAQRRLSHGRVYAHMQQRILPSRHLRPVCWRRHWRSHRAWPAGRLQAARRPLHVPQTVRPSPLLVFSHVGTQRHHLPHHTARSHLSYAYYLYVIIGLWRRHDTRVAYVDGRAAGGERRLAAGRNRGLGLRRASQNRDVTPAAWLTRADGRAGAYKQSRRRAAWRFVIQNRAQTFVKTDQSWTAKYSTKRNIFVSLSSIPYQSYLKSLVFHRSRFIAGLVS